MADPPRRAQPRVTVHHRAHQLVGVQRALHQRFGLTGAGHGDGCFGGGVAMLGCNDLVCRKIELRLRGSGADFMLRPDQHGHDELLARAASTAPSSDTVSTGCTTAVRMALKPLGHLDELPVAAPFVAKLDFREYDTSTADLFRGRNHLRSPGYDVLAALVHRPAFENDVMDFFDLLRDFDGYGDGVAKPNGQAEMQRLIHIDRSWAGKLSSEHRRDQRCAPHPVRHDLVEHVALGKGLVHMGGIDVSRHNREHLDVFVSERADEACRVSGL